MKDRDLLKLLKKNGWNVVRINGSHHLPNPAQGGNYHVICISRHFSQRR